MIHRRTLLRAGATAGAVAGLGAAAAPWAAGAAEARTPWGSLRARLGGELVLPGDPSYATAKQLQMARYDSVLPRGIAYCASVADVTSCVRFAQDHGLATAVRSGGHSQAGYSTSTGLVIDVSRLNGVRPGDGTVRVGAGGQSVDIINSLARYGIQVSSGTCPTVAVGGWLQGGGFGLTARKFGMGADRLVSARVVLANGSAVRCSATEHPDLYWALRGGGGGNFGVVTEYEVRPVQVPSVVLYNLTFDGGQAVEVVRAWQEWIAQGPRELAGELFLLLPEDSPAGTPPTVVVSGGYLGSRDACDRVLDRLADGLGLRPASREVDELPYQQALMTVFGCADRTVAECHRVGYSPHARLPRENWATYRNTFFSRPWTRATAEAAVSALVSDPAPGQFRFLGLFAYGGRVNDPAPTDTAFVHRDSLFEAGFQVGLADAEPAPEQRDRAQSWVDTGYATLAAASGGRSYQNYMDPALTNWRQAYYGQNYPRLRTVKRAYDPYRFFRFPQSVD
ncbi:FAD-binding oxidoreductase [Streptomyces sp. NPDC053755]|uniref:FAD-binding oxidoreductase n=1 Tax=Streptomyces sp. NPDC053755 TaxID=3155815 RepID=UPI00343D63B8